VNPRVVGLTPLADHGLMLQINSGEHRRLGLDVRPYRAYGVFGRLREAGLQCLGAA
jgi:hypothetical protein